MGEEKTAPLGFDHVYFELGLLLGHLQGAPPERLLSLLEALEIHPRKARVVEMRFFGGLSVAETADVLQVSPAR